MSFSHKIICNIPGIKDEGLRFLSPKLFLFLLYVLLAPAVRQLMMTRKIHHFFSFIRYFQTPCVWEDGELVPSYEPSELLELNFLVINPEDTPEENKRSVSKIVIHPGFNMEGIRL